MSKVIHKFLCGWFLLIISVCLLMITGCPKHKQVSATDSPGQSTDEPTSSDEITASTEPMIPKWEGKAPKQATLAFTGNFHGFLKPCGCAVQQSGGLLRLATLMDHLTKRLADQSWESELNNYYHLPSMVSESQPIWLIDCGNFADCNSHYPAVRAKTHLLAMSQIVESGFRAVILGSSELELPADIAIEAFKDSPVPLVGCNLVSQEQKIKINKYVELAPGWYISGVSTYTGTAFENDEDQWWDLTDPVAAVEDVLAELPDDAKLILSAVYQEGEVIRRIASMPIEMVIGHGSDHDQQWTSDLAPAYKTPKPKGVEIQMVSINTEADSSLDQSRHTSWDVQMDEQWSDAERIVQVIEKEKETINAKLKARLAEGGSEGWRETEWGISDKFLPDTEAKYERYRDGDPIYVGAKECLACHESEYNVWNESHHKDAFLSLMRKHEEETLDCLSCHVVGLLEPSGFNPFDRRDEAVAAVSCENCHGSGSKHVGLMHFGIVEDDLEISKGDKKSCSNCHDSYNSPEFEIAKYWKMIEH